MNPTIEKFGYPVTLVRDYAHWVVLLRPAQPTLGSLILAAKSDAIAYGDLPIQAFTEQAVAIAEIERVLQRFCAFERINYLMLMMVDPNVHFHVIPRYAASRRVGPFAIADRGWPGPPMLQNAITLDAAQIDDLAGQIRTLFDNLA